MSAAFGGAWSIAIVFRLALLLPSEFGDVTLRLSDGVARKVFLGTRY